MRDGHPPSMEIPAIFAAAGADGGLLAIAPADGMCVPSPGCPAVPFGDAAGRLPRPDGREPAVVADWTSLTAGRFDERVVKAMRVRGRDVWFLTWVADADDLMDAFNTTADTVLAPYHSMDGRDAMEDIVSISDSVMPAVFVRNGTALSRGRAPSGLRETLDTLDGIGFGRICVVDADSSVTPYEWGRILESFPSCVPFVADASAAEGFRDVVTPLRRPSRV